MARRKVTRAEKARDGTVLGISGPSFGYSPTRDVIADILAGRHVYFVREGPYESTVRVVGDGSNRHLVTTHDILSPNHLDNLPPHVRWFRRIR
jgi:hypothetical protein